jgi:2-dehydropantoate 2-reductase
MKSGTWPNIAVMGAGAIGCYFGGMLARAQTNKVTLIGRRKHVDPINRDGLFFQSFDLEEFIPIGSTVDIAAIGDAQLVLFCVKSGDTDEAAQTIAPYLARDAVVLSLQNGVNNVERIRSHMKNQVVPALVYAAAEMSAPGRVRHTGGGSLIINAGESNSQRPHKASRANQNGSIGLSDGTDLMTNPFRRSMPCRPARADLVPRHRELKTRALRRGLSALGC